MRFPCLPQPKKFDRLNEKIAQWRKDAEAGKTEACFNLGLAYSTGRGVVRDYVQAHKWFNLAALGGKKTAVSHRSEVAGEMSVDEIALALKYARRHLADINL